MIYIDSIAFFDAIRTIRNNSFTLKRRDAKQERLRREAAHALSCLRFAAKGKYLAAWRRAADAVAAAGEFSLETRVAHRLAVDARNKGFRTWSERRGAMRQDKQYRHLVLRRLGHPPGSSARYFEDSAFAAKVDAALRPAVIDRRHEITNQLRPGA